MPKLAIYSTRVVLDETVEEATVLVDGRKIVGVEPGYRASTDYEMVNLREFVVMPGLIDTHVHINEPGRTDWEGFETATKAAISGGVTTLVDMPLNSSPVTATVSAFDEKISATAKKLHANCGFWGGLIPGNTAEIEPLIKRGVLGFKAFLTHSGIDEFPNVTEDDLHKAMPLIARYGLPLLVHCEISREDGNHAFRDPRSYQQYLASRPTAWENDAINFMIRLCEQHQCRVHIVHLSSAEAIESIAAARHRGLPLTVETAQHYLYFSAEMIPDGNTAFKCAPPIRDRENNDKLWEALAQGVIDFVATDHSPAPPSVKLLDSGDLSKAWGGIASIQFALPVLWTAAKERDFQVADIVKWLGANPAKLAGLHQRKGRIAQGFDADLVVWDPAERFVVTEQMIHHKHKITPYLGERLYGVVKQTYLMGQKVYDGRHFLKLHSGSLLIRDI